MGLGKCAKGEKDQEGPLASRRLIRQRLGSLLIGLWLACYRDSLKLGAAQGFAVRVLQGRPVKEKRYLTK